MDTSANKYITTEAFITRIQVFAANCKPSITISEFLVSINNPARRFQLYFREAALLVCTFFSESFVSAGKSWKGRAQTSHLNSALKTCERLTCIWHQGQFIASTWTPQCVACRLLTWKRFLSRPSKAIWFSHLWGSGWLCQVLIIKPGSTLVTLRRDI